MKQTTLEDLYYGNINPNETSFVRASEYGKCFDKVTELSKSVCSQLPEEYINKMNELESAIIYYFLKWIFHYVYVIIINKVSFKGMRYY